jgi:hypothetical protein
MEQTINEQRVDVLRDVAGILEINFDYDNALSFENNAKTRSDEIAVLPTIGCEVEVKWSSLFPDLAEQYFGPFDKYGRLTKRYSELSITQRKELDDICSEIDSVLKPRYQLTEDAGIPAGLDAYWEFANSPTYSWRTLAGVVAILMDGGLIPTNHDHSLHITLGGLAIGQGGACLLLSGLELSGSSPERIAMATERTRLDTSVAWSRRGDMGMRMRSSNALSLDQKIGCEFRTLIANNVEQANQTLRAAQLLTSTLLAFRQRHNNNSSVVQDLASI